MENILEVKNLIKHFGPPASGFTAVNNISFELGDGEILGFLGPNGAGKTTTIQMLLGVLSPSNGNINYFGKSLFTHREEILDRINFSSTYTHLPWRLTVKENLTFVSYLYTIPNRKKRVDEMIEIFKLSDMLKKEMAALSAGQKTRVNLAKAFLNSPKVLLLDEPTASLDPDIAQYIRDFIVEQRKTLQTSIMFTSHNMNEVEEICDRVIFINHGKIVANDTPDILANSIKISHIELVIKDGLKRLVALCQEKKFTYKVDKRFIVVDVPTQHIADFLPDLSIRKIHYSEISIEKPSLEDYFLQTSGEKI